MIELGQKKWLLTQLEPAEQLQCSITWFRFVGKVLENELGIIIELWL